jgi:AAA family ATP:ADP antiporter
MEALEKLGEGTTSSAGGYVAFYRAQHDTSVELMSHPLIAAIMKLEGPYGRTARHAMLEAVADAPDPRAADLVLALARLPELDDEDAVELTASAMAALKDERFIPLCVERLAKRPGRDAVRDALVAMGPPALGALEAALGDESVDVHVRQHVPRSISRFGSQKAADILSARLVQEPRGAVRYKILRALGGLVARHNVTVDRGGMDAQALRNVEEHLRLLALRVALDRRTSRSKIGEDAAKQVLIGLLDDKIAQSMERAFRLLQIAHKREDIETVHAAARSTDTAARANAGEFLDVLLVRREQQRLRQLLRIVVDDANDTDRVARARDVLPSLVRTYGEALKVLLADRDEVLVALAAQHALGLNDEPLRRAVAEVQAKWPQIRTTGELLFGSPIEVAHA